MEINVAEKPMKINVAEKPMSRSSEAF